MKKFIALVFLGLLLFACSKNQIETETLHISEVTTSLVNEDHNSEGILVTLANGDILQFYRLDSGVSGDHIGNTGHIVKRISTDNGNTWSREETVYSDEYDNRNTRGGITENGTIILFFRRYDAQNHQAIDLNYIFSKDGGRIWSERKVLDFNLDLAYEVWIDNFIIIESNNYMLPIHGVGYCEIRFFSLINHTLVLTEKKWVWDYTKNHLFGIDEPMFTVVGENKILGLFRDDTEKSNYFQVTSTDFGNTWTEPTRTNICEPYFSPSPLLFFVEDQKKIIVVGTDRRQFSGDNYSAKDSQVWIYSNSIDSIFNSPHSYNLMTTINRPIKTDYMFYGYPAFTKTNNDKYLIVFTDSSFDGENEDADLFQFTIQYQ